MHQGHVPVETNASGITYQQWRERYPQLGAEEARLTWLSDSRPSRLGDPHE